MAVHKSTFGDCTHGTVVRNRLAVRIAGSHPADRGSIPRYGSNHHGLQPDNGRQEIPVPKNLFATQHTATRPLVSPSGAHPLLLLFCHLLAGVAEVLGGASLLCVSPLGRGRVSPRECALRRWCLAHSIPLSTASMSRRQSW